MWEASANLGSSGTIFTSIFHDHYNAPNGYCFSQGCTDEPIVEDEESPYYNYEMMINNFTTHYACPIAEHYPTNNILIPMGDDFRYEAAYSTFLNLDKLISGFKKFPQYCGNKLLNVFYSTPTCYTKAVNDYVNTNDITLSRKTDDFFPYVGGLTDYWTGYYTSRPTSKRFARQGSQFLQVTKQLAAAVNANYDDERTSSLREAVGNMQHHDAITGTEQQGVMKSYHRILSKSFAKAVNASNEALSILVSGNASSLDFNICVLSNVTSCDETSGDTFTVLIYNPLSRVASPHVQLPVNGENWMITGPDGESVEYAMSKPIRDFSYMNDIKISSDILLLKAINIPALGFKIYQIEKEQSKSTLVRKVSGSKYGSDDTFVELDNYGLLANITIRGISLPVKQEFLYYNSSYENGQVSGAYVFRPNSTKTTTIANGNVRVDVTKSSYVYEVRQVFSSWITQIIRIYTDEHFIELDWAVGPIPRKGIEVISRFSTPLKTNSKFYTDSNGREMIERIRDHRNGYLYTNREPVSANYYPVTSRIVLKDDESNLEFAVLNDRAQGGSSLRDGEIEIMVHRRCVSDDGFGVSEPLDEQEYNQPLIVRGQHYLTVGNIVVDETKTSAALQRDIAQKKSFEPWVFATSQPNPNLKVKQLSILNRDLPVNVQLLTLELWNINTILIRFEHVMEKTEDPKLSANVTLDIKDLFKTFVVEDIQETTLSGTVLESDNKRLQWPGIRDQTKRIPNDFEITLEPMQIRTFLAKVDYNVSA